MNHGKTQTEQNVQNMNDTANKDHHYNKSVYGKTIVCSLARAVYYI